MNLGKGNIAKLKIGCYVGCFINVFILKDTNDPFYIIFGILCIYVFFAIIIIETSEKNQQ